MSSSTNLSSAGLDPRRRRILFRARHRGMREMDILFSTFAEAELPAMSDADMGDFERLLDETADRDVLMWLTDEAPVWPQFDTPVYRRLKAFHTHSGPLDL